MTGSNKETDDKPLFDKKTSQAVEKISANMKARFNAYLNQGVAKDVLMKDANAFADAILEGLDRADAKEDGKITKATLKKAVDLFNTSMPSSQSSDMVAQFKKDMNVKIEKITEKDGSLQLTDAKKFLSNEIKAYLGKVVTVIDGNKDNIISATESIFTLADKNKSGSISIEEALNAIKTIGFKAGKKLNVRELAELSGAFFTLDKDDNLSLSKAEVRAGLNKITASYHVTEAGSMASPALKSSVKGGIQK